MRLLLITCLAVLAATTTSDSTYAAALRRPAQSECNRNAGCGQPLDCGPGGMCREQCQDNSDCHVGLVCETQSWCAGRSFGPWDTATLMMSCPAAFDTRFYGYINVCVPPPGHGIKPANFVGAMVPGLDMPGHDYKSVPDVANAAACRTLCEHEPGGICQAWTYVNPGVQNPIGICYLKNTVPAQKLDDCCTSGQVPVSRQQPGPTPQ